MSDSQEGPSVSRTTRSQAAREGSAGASSGPFLQQQELITSPGGSLGVGGPARSDPSEERFKAIEAALAEFSALLRASGPSAPPLARRPRPAAEQFDDYDDGASTLSGEGLATAAVVAQALQLAGDPCKDLAFDPSKRFLSKAWSEALERGKTSQKLKWSETTVRLTNAILALVRAHGALFSAQGTEKALEEALDADPSQAFEAALSALELLQSSLYFDDEKRGRDLCEAAELDIENAEKKAFARLPLARPALAKKVAELKAYDSRSAFRKLQDQAPGGAAAGASKDGFRSAMDSDALQKAEQQIKSLKAQVASADRQVSYATSKFKENKIAWEPPPKPAAGRGRGAGRGANGAAKTGGAAQP